jgi:hypothetical protein
MSSGRPSSYTQQIAERICLELADGCSLRSICAEEWAPETRTVLRWLYANEEFRLQYARAREQQAEMMADELLDIADDGTNDWMERQKRDGSTEIVPDHEHINRSRLRVDTRKWVASKLLAKKYGDKVAVTDPDGGQAVMRVLIEHVGHQGKTPA